MTTTGRLAVQEDPLCRWKRLSVFQNGFHYGSQQYAFEDIEYIEFQGFAINVSVNLLPAGTDYEAHLKITLTGGRGTVRADFNGSITKWPLASAKGKAERVCAVYTEIAQRSFEHRMRKYVNSLKDYGYFMYDGAKFYPDGKVTSGHKEGKIGVHELCMLDSTLLVQIPGPNGRPAGLFRQILSGDPKIYVEVQKDRDCFDMLLRTMYGLSITDL